MERRLSGPNVFKDESKNSRHDLEVFQLSLWIKFVVSGSNCILFFSICCKLRLFESFAPLRF